MTKNATYTTHKSSNEGRALTIERKRTRADKYRPVVANRNMGE